MTHFVDQLADAVRRCGNAIAVGLDPRWEQLPAGFHDGSSAQSPATRAQAYREFCRGVIDVVASLVPTVKIQVACFEQLGPQGMLALADVIDLAHQASLLVILDAKRNDIGSTAQAYADGLLGRGSAWGADALTVSPYLGDDSLEPFVTTACQRQAGIFVLVKTSNPGGAQFQDLIADGRPLYRHVAEYVEKLSLQSLGACNYGLVGAVAGATYPRQLAELRAVMPHAWLLIPGFGSQGAGARDVAAGFDDQGLGAIVNNSRGIIFAHAQARFSQFGPGRWQEAVAASTREMIDQLRAETPLGRLSVI